MRFGLLWSYGTSLLATPEASSRGIGIGLMVVGLVGLGYFCGCLRQLSIVGGLLADAKRNLLDSELRLDKALESLRESKRLYEQLPDALREARRANIEWLWFNGRLYRVADGMPMMTEREIQTAQRFRKLFKPVGEASDATH